MIELCNTCLGCNQQENPNFNGLPCCPNWIDGREPEGQIEMEEKQVKRIDYIRAMTVEEMAQIIMDNNITDNFCKSDCEDENGCLHEKECCIRWLNEEDPSFASIVWKDR